MLIRRSQPFRHAAAVLGATLLAGVAAATPADPLEIAADEVAAGRMLQAVAALRALFESGHPTPADALADPRFAALREDDAGRRAWRELMREFPRQSRLTMVTPDEPGMPMLIRGRVVSSPGGEPVAGAVLELYHTDDSGRYEPSEAVGEDANSRLFAFVRSDDHGRFEVRTIKPGPYPGAGPGAAHVHYIIEAEGHRRYGADFRPYDHPRSADERATAIQRGHRFSVVREENGTLICEVTIPLGRRLQR